VDVLTYAYTGQRPVARTFLTDLAPQSGDVAQDGPAFPAWDSVLKPTTIDLQGLTPAAGIIYASGLRQGIPFSVPANTLDGTSQPSELYLAHGFFDEFAILIIAPVGQSYSNASFVSIRLDWPPIPEETTLSLDFTKDVMAPPDDLVISHDANAIDFRPPPTYACRGNQGHPDAFWWSIGGAEKVVGGRNTGRPSAAAEVTRAGSTACCSSLA
jgi:hypothetical protein